MKPITDIAGCCARAASGHVAAAPPSRVMNSRRLMRAPRPRTRHRTGEPSGLKGRYVSGRCARGPISELLIFRERKFLTALDKSGTCQLQTILQRGLRRICPSHTQGKPWRSLTSSDRAQAKTERGLSPAVIGAAALAACRHQETCAMGLASLLRGSCESPLRPSPLCSAAPLRLSP